MVNYDFHGKTYEITEAEALVADMKKEEMKIMRNSRNG